MLVRTSGLPSADSLSEAGIPFSTLDALYEKSRNYDTLTRHIVEEVKRRARGRKVAYCVDGSPFEDAAARILLEEGAEGVEGVSKAAHFAAKAGVYGGYCARSAFEPLTYLSLPLIVYDVTADTIGDVKLALAERFGDEAPACYIDERGAVKLPLYEADRQGVCGYATAIVLYDVPLLEKKKFCFEDFVAIMRLLRAPDGCPWDSVQTHESIRNAAIEEAYELVDAIDRKDPERIREEAGDVLMQSVFHSLMEEERGEFTVTDMVTALCEKLITRHTHVFGKDRAADAEGALSVWERNKMTEKHQATYSDAVNDVPACFPALLRAQKIAKRMEKGGWDKATFENFERKFREEYQELREAVNAKDEAAIAEELGDVLFCTVELGRAAGADCELALLDTVRKMAERYNRYEAMVRADGKDVNALTEEEKAEYYRRAKYAS